MTSCLRVGTIFWLPTMTGTARWRNVQAQQWTRGRAWAFEQAMGLVWYYAQSNPTMSALGRRTLHRLTTCASP